VLLLTIAERMHSWVTDYGYLGIFVLLVLGIVGVPVPDETLLTYVGHLSARGELRLLPTIIAAVLGSSCGITISYFLGRTAGNWLMTKFGPFLHITPPRMEKVHGWFERFGRWTLVIGYFIPGVRHLTAFAAGTSRLEFPVFSLFAYSGALIWSNAFILAGYFLSREWRKVGHLGHTIIAAAAAVILLGAGAVTYLLHRRARRLRGGLGGSNEGGSAVVDAPIPPRPPSP
jgi:membrane protein DedA with SNARE-associated domain